MRSKCNLMVVMVLFLGMLISPGAEGSPTEQNDRTLSPYFFVKSDDGTVDQLPLKSTSAQVNVAGVIADVQVTQVYQNEGKRPLEAIYVFPASTRAAVYGMRMTVGSRTIVAEIREREKARQDYEEARQSGKSASLLEQQRPNVFQMNVANILPGDVIRVELKYTELLVPTEGIYEFVYPTVVGPRYSNQRASETPPAEHWVANPYLPEGESPPYRFDIEVHLAAGLPLQEVTCPSHRVHTRYENRSRATVSIDPGEKNGGNRDFILRYRLAGGQVQSGLLLFEGAKENFFLLMVQPPNRVPAGQIPPREYIFIVDVSGSMHGFPLDISKTLLRDLIGNLRPVDKFNVLLFSGGNSVMSEQSVPATPENIHHAINVIDHQKGGGGTELLPALKRALSLPHAEGCSRTIVIATDGYVSVEKEAFDLIRKHLGEANMFTFGIGSSVNRFLIEGMARAGMGEPFVVSKPGEARGYAERFRKMIETPVLTDIRVDYGAFEVYDVEPPSVPDVFAERPVVVFGTWRGRRAGTIRVQGKTGNSYSTHKMEVQRERSCDTNAVLRYLWARHRIATLSDYNQLQQDNDRIKEITQLGLTYTLLTAHTSFVAIDTEVRLVNGQPVTIKQPLPLPEGVSNRAVGGGIARQKSFSAAAPAMGFVAQEREAKDEVTDHSSKGRRKDSVEIEKLSTSAGLSGETVLAALRPEIASLEISCQKTLAKPPAAEASLTFECIVDPSGRITHVRVIKSDLHEKDLERCIAQKLKEVRLSARSTTKDDTFTVSLRLRWG